MNLDRRHRWYAWDHRHGGTWQRVLPGVQATGMAVCFACGLATFEPIAATIPADMKGTTQNDD